MGSERRNQSRQINWKWDLLPTLPFYCPLNYKRCLAATPVCVFIAYPSLPLSIFFHCSCSLLLFFFSSSTWAVSRSWCFYPAGINSEPHVNSPFFIELYFKDRLQVDWHQDWMRTHLLAVAHLLVPAAQRPRRLWLVIGWRWCNVSRQASTTIRALCFLGHVR